MRKCIITVFLAGSFCLLCNAQSQQFISFENIVEMNTADTHKHNYSPYFHDCSNELQLVTTGFFVGYKSFISSQDYRGCTFNPSCSVYAIETIKKKGIFIGFMDAVDRLTRCNGLSPEEYEIDYEQQLLIDFP